MTNLSGNCRFEKSRDGEVCQILCHPAPGYCVHMWTCLRFLKRPQNGCLYPDTSRVVEVTKGLMPPHHHMCLGSSKCLNQMYKAGANDCAHSYVGCSNQILIMGVRTVQHLNLWTRFGIC